jgi:outer membrane protein assembly factor BamB
MDVTLLSFVGEKHLFQGDGMSESISQVPDSGLTETTAPAGMGKLGGPPHAAPGPRLWPVLGMVLIQWLIMLVPGWVAPATPFHFYGAFLGPLVGCLAVAVWWAFASRLGRADRWFGLLLYAAAGTITWFLAHPSLGLFGLLLYALPATTTALAVWLVATPFLRWPVRRAGLLAVLLLTWGYFLLVRHEGVDGNFSASLPWRWSVTAEGRFLAERSAREQRLPTPENGPGLLLERAEALVLQPGDWPGFRGADRDGRRAGVRIATDWNERPPRQLWRQRVGPGWSSFAAVGTRLYTQEQRGALEVVVCYDAGSGAELWLHEDAARFTETMGGAGPRATPTFHEGKIYAQGATGKLNCLDALTGRVLWSRDVAADSGADVPQWGFAASPLVVQGVVSVFAGGADGKSVLGYEASSGTLAWSAGEGQFSYCSPHLAHVDGTAQLLIATDRGLAAFHPARGEVLWQHDWPLEGGMARVVQPTVLGDADFLLGTGFGNGTRRVHVRRDADAWTTQEVWTTRAIKPYYNDLVVHREHLYGFDHNFLTCVSLADGKTKWRARGYGNGQVLLLPDQDLLLVQAETGEVALVDASPDRHRQRARFQALDGKTWNHPVVAHGKLFVRNGQEAACYELASAEW